MTIERRQFLKVISAAGAAAAVQGCSSAPPEALIPYLVSPDNVVPAEESFVATTCRECPAGCGMLVRTVDARALKVEGNPRHPTNAGSLCARGQAAVQSLYDPDRFTGARLRGADGQLHAIAWHDAETMLAAKLREARQRGSGRVAWIGELVTGSMDRLIRDWLEMMNGGRRVLFEPFDYEPLRRAAEMVTGRREVPRYRLDRADLVLSFGAEFLDTWLSHVEFAREYADLRRRREDASGASCVVLAPRASMTGLNADRWVAVRPGGEAALALAIVHALIEEGAVHASARPHVEWIRPMVAPFAPEAIAAATGVAAQDVRAVARRLAAAQSPIALGGGISSRDPRAVDLEVAVLLVNAVAGAFGQTVTFGAGWAVDRLSTRDDAGALLNAMERGDIDVLLVHHANPVDTSPLPFDAALAHVPFVVSFASRPDETSARAHLLLPDRHALEQWGDYSPRTGVDGLIQPAMTSVADTRATGDVLLDLGRQVDPQAAGPFGDGDFGAYVARSWNAASAADPAWIDARRRGGRFEEAPPVEAPLRTFDYHFAAPASVDGLTLVTFPSPLLYDGRGANNGWLQEIPDPVSHIVWSDWIEVHPETAARLGLRQDDVVEVSSEHGRVSVTVRVYDGVQQDVVAMPLGYGRSARLRTAGSGVRAVTLLPPDGQSWRVGGVSLRRTSARRLTVLQADGEEHPGRPAIAETIAPAMPPHGPARPPDLYAPHAHAGHRWGMAIDLNTCTGCSACVAACYSENNVPVVGPAACADGREMSWIRIERYDRRRDANFGAVFLPMLCQQCDEAPCEPVCPVYATYHNPEGLNAQVYVRCIGTRFCSNNCPYKVRRFNWTAPSWPSPLNWQLNPDVTVRSAGVMEKCTFCVQRIQRGKDNAAAESRALEDGDIVPACAQTCPAGAIVFGDLNDPQSRVSRLSANGRAYHVLEELNTRPAVTYLRRVAPEESTR